MKILFIENHAVFASVVTQQFLSEHEVKVVPSLSACIEAMQLDTPDVTLVDYDLDDCKGDEVVRFLRQKSPELFVVGVSSKDSGNQMLVAAGADLICAKSDFAKLPEMLRAHQIKRGRL